MRERIDVPAMTALSGGHLAVDFAGGALFVLIPYLHDKFDLSYTLAAVLVLFLVFLNTYAGVREVDQDLIDGARLMRATRTQIVTKVIIPSAMSWVFAGLKIAMPYALIGAVLGEMIAANRGLGYLVQFSGAQFDTAGVFAVLIVIALLAVTLNYLVELAQGRIERWRIISR